MIRPMAGWLLAAAMAGWLLAAAALATDDVGRAWQRVPGASYRGEDLPAPAALLANASPSLHLASAWGAHNAAAPLPPHPHLFRRIAAHVSLLPLVDRSEPRVSSRHPKRRKLRRVVRVVEEAHLPRRVTFLRGRALAEDVRAVLPQLPFARNLGKPASGVRWRRKVGGMVMRWLGMRVGPVRRRSCGLSSSWRRHTVPE